MPIKKFVYFFLIALPSAFIFSSCTHPKPTDKQSAADDLFQDEDAYTVFKNKNTVPKVFELNPNIQVLLDSLSEIKLLDSITNDHIILKLDGIAHFTIYKSKHPIIIYTGMMKLSTEAVNFKINAYNSSPGQSLKVFEGQLIATKSYKSDFPNTDTLHRGDMILINRDIDLMEKETFDTTVLSSKL